jgi:sulfur-carrier protein
MSAKVGLFASLQQSAGVGEIRISASNVGSLLRQLTDRFPVIRSEVWEDEKMLRLSERVKVMVNGRNIDFMDGLSTVLDEEDRVAIFPPVGGG